MSVKVIFWDLGNVLFKIRINDFLNEVFTKSKKDSKNLDAVRKIITSSFKGKISLSETMAQLSLTTECDKQILYELLELDWILANDELIDYILTISGICKQGIISDLWSIPYYWIQKRYHNFLRIFVNEMLMFSNLTGLTKRDEGDAYLKQILKNLNLQPYSVCMIDDSVATIETANMIGLQTIHYPKVCLSHGNVDWKEANQQVIKSLEQILV